MVGIHYRWDFIGLSTDQKPTPETSEKVVNGSTFYCSDNSKLYVFCDGTWYERKSLGGGGGSYVAGNGIDITDDTISVDTTTIQPKLTAGSNVTISDDTISATDTTYSNFTGTDGTAAGAAGLVPAPATTDAGKFLKADGTWGTAGGGSGITELTSADYNWPTNNPTSVALWKLNSGAYMWGDVSVKASSSTDVSYDHFAIVGEKQTGGGLVNIISLGDGSSQTSGNYNLVNTYTVEYTSGNLLNSKYALTRDNVAQSTGTSATSVMSQNAVTSMVYADPDTKKKISLGTRGSSGASATAIGDGAAATGNHSVALGSGAYATSKGEMNIGVSALGSRLGYNSTQYRLLTGLYDGQTAHDAATKGQLDSIAIQNAGAPTTATVGTVGQLLEDTTNGKLYQCTDATGGSYTWVEVGAGGGSGPTVVQTTGTSTTDVMSQNAVTSMLYADPTTKYKVQIGQTTSATGGTSVVVGRNSNVAGNGGVAVGGYCSAGADNSIALGRGASATSQGQFDISVNGTGVYSDSGYNNSNYRLISGVYDGQSAHDAATVAQGNTLSTSAPTTSTVGVLGQLYTDTTNMHTYQCTAISGGTYTWTQRW